MKLLIVGLGSMGKRRARLSKGIDAALHIVGVDPAEARRAEACTLGLADAAYPTIAEAVAAEHPDAALVCTAPLSHAAVIGELLDNDLPVFTELNLVGDGYAENMAKAAAKNLPLFLSSTMLYRRETQYIKQQVQAFGKPVHYIYHIGQYLPDWHPWENYKNFFVGNARTGGVREIFGIDLPWLLDAFGDVESVTVQKDTISDLGLPYPDCVTLLLRHKGGVQGVLAADVVSRKAVRSFECFGDGILMFFDALVLGLLALYRMWCMDRRMTILALIPAAFMFAIGTVMGKTMTKTWEKRQQAFSDLSDFAQENFSGIAVIKAFVKELKELIAFRKLNKDNEEVNVEYTRISVLLEVMVTFFVESVICVILGYGGYLVYKGDFNAGQLVEYIGYFEAIVWPIMAISMLIEKTSRGKASLNRITELLDAPIDVADRAGVPDLENPKGGIEFRDLTFRYPDGEFDVLKNISFTIQPGESVGIVGKTGAGKTALVDLLLRTYNVPDGTLFVDGKDVNGVSIHSVRQACAYVPQENFLFSDTIAHNIAFGVDDATPEDIERAASLADVRDNIVDFKDGYETVLGERGVTVSGGQKQRISIARALLKDAPILILDDSVSAVDTRTEKIILDNLRLSRTGKTTLLIAHRISTVERLDKIIFLEDGKVEAVGPHDQLYASCPEYRKMVDLQKLEDEVGGGNA